VHNDQCNIVKEVEKSTVMMESTTNACAAEYHGQIVVKEVLKSDDGAPDTSSVECDEQNDINYAVEKRMMR